MQEDTCKKAKGQKLNPANILAVVFLVGLVSLDMALHYHRGTQIQQLGELTSRLDLELKLLQSTRSINQRTKRQVESAHNLAEDGSPIVLGNSYTGNEAQNTEGLRIYDAWFQHRNNHEIPQKEQVAAEPPQRSGESIQPHHRKSASWVDDEDFEGPGHNLNTHFDNKIYRDSYPKASGRKSESAIDLPNKNRAKYTADKKLGGGARRNTTSNSRPRNYDAPPASTSFSSGGYQVSGALPVIRVVSNEDPPPRPAALTRQRASSSSSEKKGRKKASYDYEQRASRNRAGLRSMDAAAKRMPSAARGRMRMLGGRRKLRKSGGSSGYRGGGSLASQFSGLKSVHYVGDLDRTSVNAHEYHGVGLAQNEDGVYRKWTPARWVSKMGANLAFPMSRDGKMTITEPGVYYLYAQINYLDDHDVNAFQIYANEDPFLLCTAMTHTRHKTNTKANTCYTGGVMYLEAGDEIYVRDLEPERFSVLLPAHTFMGAIQLSSAK